MVLGDGADGSGVQRAGVLPVQFQFLQVPRHQGEGRGAEGLGRVGGGGRGGGGRGGRGSGGVDHLQRHSCYDWLHFLNNSNDTYACNCTRTYTCTYMYNVHTCT